MANLLSRITHTLRTFRTYHKYLGLCLALILLISAVTGTLLAWKKNSDLLQPPTREGQAEGLQDWMPLDQLALMARQALERMHPEKPTPVIDRMDVRPDKGIVKVLFDRGWWEVQLDGSTGAVLSIARRHSDWIEKVHDGSIISDLFKLVLMNILGVGILLLILTGGWLWYGPKLFRRYRHRRT